MRRALSGLTVLLTLAAVTTTSAAALQDRGRERDGRRLQPDVRSGAQARQDEAPRATGAADTAQSRAELAQAAAGVSEAWLAHDAGTIVAASPQLVIQLPGADPSAALSPRQAAALLTDFFATAREVEVGVRSAKEVEPGRGFVELRRKYQVNGTQDVRAQSVFLGYRKGQQGWILVELKAIEP